MNRKDEDGIEEFYPTFEELSTLIKTDGPKLSKDAKDEMYKSFAKIMSPKPTRIIKTEQLTKQAEKREMKK